ncbi:MAG: kelch repeat-containing protein [Planctomycetota bacterium]
MSKRLVSVTLFLVTVVPSQTPQQPTWSLLTPTASPPGRYNFAMAHDPVRARTVMFGGHPGPSNDAWEFDGVTWAQRTPTIVPPARCCHTMAYVPAYANIVLFGGSTSSNDVDSLDDTWQWDGATWTQLAPSTSPSARMAQAMATDWLAGQVVLFGGRDTQSQHQGDTWTWNGTTWTLITSSGPPPRCCHSMAQDIASGRIVMFGGWAGVDQGDTWEFDGTSWQQAIPTGSAPSPRWGHRIAYDPVNGRLVLRGGFNGGSLTGAETWQWNGRQWTLLTLTALQTYNHELAFD